MLKFGQMNLFNGYVFGFRHASIAVPVLSHAALEARSQRLTKFIDLLAEKAGLEARLWFAKASVPENLVREDWFLPLLVGLHVSLGLPEVRHRTLRNVGEQKKTFVICEAFEINFLLKSLNFLQDAFSREKWVESEILLGFSALQKTPPPIARQGTNIRHFVKAAWALDIPVCVLPDFALNFGMGARALAMSSSITGRTGALAVKRARDKAATHRLMAMWGLPVTEQGVAETLEQACLIARSIGYPVVVKPRALDGGTGVTTEIRSDAALEQAFQKVAALSQAALIERQLQGNEYRFLFVKGQLISVHQRVPARVVGNGRNTVAELVSAENVKRRAAVQTGFTNVPIKLNEDALNQISAQGLATSSVPEAGRIVRLATVPRVSTGGAVHTAIDLSVIEPAILSAASHAVKLAGLDVAGVDIITTDLGKPLCETGGAITEVNARPQINRFEHFDVHARVLQALINGNGRIPCVLILAENKQAGPLLSALADRMGALLESIGLLLADGAPSREAQARFGGVVTLNGLPALLAHPDVCGIVAVMPMSHVLAKGLPLDRFHSTVILGALHEAEAAKLASPLLLPHLCGTIFHPSGSTVAAALSSAAPALGFSSFDDLDILARQIADVLQKGAPLRTNTIAAAGRS